jgi:hypothetical protein
MGQGPPLDQSIGPGSSQKTKKDQGTNNLSAPVKHENKNKKSKRGLTRNETHTTQWTAETSRPPAPTTFGRGPRGLIPEKYPELPTKSVSRSSYYSACASVDSRGARRRVYKRSKKNQSISRGSMDEEHEPCNLNLDINKLDKSQIIQFEQNSHHEEEPYVDDDEEEETGEEEPREALTLYVDDESSQFPAVSSRKHNQVVGHDTTDSRNAFKNLKNELSTDNLNAGQYRSFSDHPNMDSIYDHRVVEEHNGMIPLTTVIDEESNICSDIKSHEIDQKIFEEIQSKEEDRILQHNASFMVI